jgi:transcription factor SPN1
MDDSDDDNDLFGANSDSDDTADLIKTSTVEKKGKSSSSAKKRAPKPTPKGSSASGDGGLFDSDSDDDNNDDDDLGNMDAKKKRLEALAQKRKKKETRSAPPKPSKRRKESGPKKGDGKGYESADSYDSNDIHRTADDDAFLDTAGEDPEAVNDLYKEQLFDDDRPDKSKKKKRRVQGQQDEDANDPIMSVVKKSDGAIHDEVNSFLRQMALAADRDEAAIAERKPALNKINMLSDVCTMLTVKDMQLPLLEADLLETCRRCM